MISPRQPARLWELARELSLGWTSTAKLFVTYYGSRRRALGKVFPQVVTLDLPAWGKVALRCNECDQGLLLQIFVRKDYRMEASGVRRILDLGANTGMAAVFLHRLFPEAEIACVEPSPVNTPSLRRTVALNGIHGRVFDGAIGAEPGFVDLYLSDRPDSNSVIPTGQAGPKVRVPQFSVPQIMEQMDWDGIDVLKMDIEGAEKGLFGPRSTWLNQVRYVTGESHIGVGYPYAALRADLEAYGFVLETLIPETGEYGASFRGVGTRHLD